MNQGKGNRGKGDTVVKSWYTTLVVEDAYSAVVEESDTWREEDKRNAERISSSLAYRAPTLLSGRRAGDRFEAAEEIPPRLYRMQNRTGPIYFELINVAEGGTVVKATYPSSIRARVMRFKATQPLEIPRIPLGTRCPSCGQAVLPEFSLCPYCGEEMLKE
ncbi:MAG TPA: zinc ribbon domain-containing protein [Patescibacteria group bacterium]|nr:zinc ribbon domain-containing protein [Patescibacteria group bacterium]